MASAEKLSKEALAVGDSAVTPEDVVGLQQQVARIATLVAGGSLAGRVETTAVSDDEVATAEQINAILDAMQTSVVSVTEGLERMGQGEIPEQTEGPCADGEMARLYGGLNAATSAVGGLIDAIDTYHTRQVDEGDFEYHIELQDLPGVFQRAAAQVDASADIHIDFVLELLGVLVAYSKGDFSPTIKPRRGKQVIANESVDALRSNLTGLQAQVELLLAAAENDDLTVRGDTENLAGTFAQVVDGFNRTLDRFADKTHLYDAILDSVPFPISVTDLDMRWLFLNKAV